MEKRIWLFHLFNDYSGSPLILKNTVLAMQDVAKLTICTSPTEGFLSNLDGINYQSVNYEWSPSKWKTLYRFLKVQWALFFMVLKNKHHIDTIYVNTLLPFGAALAGKLAGKKVVYHLHEPQVSPASLFRFLVKVADWTAEEVIFVSDYIKSCFPQLHSRGKVIYNVLNESFLAEIHRSATDQKQTVLMLCSFKAYKGIHEFVALSKMNSRISFELVLNSSHESIKEFIKEHEAIDNLTIFPATTEVHSFYQRARVVVNLSHPNAWIESFGMTALESMAYATPCIVPTVGGISELVSASSGFQLSCFNFEMISKVLEQLFDDEDYYLQFSSSAKSRSEKFVFDEYQKEIRKLIA